jgi:hypothetical protein
MRLHLVFVFAAATLLASCASGPAPVPATTPASAYADVARFFPLAVGNSWTYQSRLGHQVERSTVRIEQKQGAFFHDNQRGTLAFDGEGLRDQRRYLILGPIEAGRSWESLLENGQRERYEIVQTGATAVVPAGTFEDALVVRGTTPMDPTTSLQVEWTYAPDVGLVRMTSAVLVARKDPVPQAEVELLSFSLRP